MPGASGASSGPASEGAGVRRVVISRRRRRLSSSAGRERSPRLRRSHSAATARRTSVTSAAASALARSTSSRARAVALASVAWAAARRAAVSLSRRSITSVRSASVRLASSSRAMSWLTRAASADRWPCARAMRSGESPSRRGDGECVALAGDVVAQSERRRQGGRVELHRGVARAGLAGGERAERLEVGGGHHQRAAIGQRLEDRLGQRGALVGIGAGAQLVERARASDGPPRPAPRGSASRTRRRWRGSRPPTARPR